MTAENNTFERLLTESEVAKLLSVSLATIRRRRLLRQPPEFVKIGTCVRYQPKAVEELIRDGIHRSGDTANSLAAGHGESTPHTTKGNPVRAGGADA
jgi:predicted DNA-binding transcriptional regulator AlpA